MYIEQILWLASWPALIVAAYYVVKAGILKFEALRECEDKKAESELK